MKYTLERSKNYVDSLNSSKSIDLTRLLRRLGYLYKIEGAEHMSKLK